MKKKLSKKILALGLCSTIRLGLEVCDRTPTNARPVERTLAGKLLLGFETRTTFAGYLRPVPGTDSFAA